MTTDTTSTMVDINVPRFNQGSVALLTALAFVFDWKALVAATFAILAVSWLGGPRMALFTRMYTGLLRQRGPKEFEDAAPPRFAQLLGTVFLGVSTFALYAGFEYVGWTVTLLVTALAALAATTRICVGCLIYSRVVR